MTSNARERSGPPLSEEHMACLGLGSNVEPGVHLRRAIKRLRAAVGVEAISGAWESPAVGSDGPDYVNLAILVHTPLTRELLLARLKQIECELGRFKAEGPAGDRLTIDIDMIIFDCEVLEEDLWSQAYRAVPVAELLPDLRCPATGESLCDTAKRLAAPLAMKQRSEIFADSHWPGTSRAASTEPSWTRPS